MSSAPDARVLGASFRDPSGFLFERAGVLFRQVERGYAPHYDRLMGSGLYEELTKRELLIPHREREDVAPLRGDPHRILEPERIPFVSYPYEWCFGQLRDAARLTLEIERTALRHGMTLKDASAYNVQFRRGRPIFIDTLSFEVWREGAPWVGYRQFCQHFLAPLALMARRDVRLAQLLRVHLDGIPLDLARSLLPARARLDVHLLLHVVLHARYQRRYAGDAAAAARARPLSRRARENLLAGLEAALRKLRWEPAGTAWADYYEGDSYDEAAAASKCAGVAAFLDRIAPATVIDLGANTGVMSRLACERGARTLAFDADPACVEQCYRDVRARGEERLLPLLLDLTNPSPALGWAHDERDSLLARGGAEALLALALVHHLAIANNVPLARVAAFFAALAEQLIVEFVPKGDPKVDRLLATREDVFPDYTRQGFEAAFASRFEIRERAPIEGSPRALYWMTRRAGAPSPDPRFEEEATRRG